MKCGFCNAEFTKFKDLKKVSFLARNQIVIICPNCLSILGFYYKG